MSAESVTVIAVGDIFLGEHPVTLNHGVNSIVQKKGCDFLLSNVANYLKEADVVCGNLEGIISPKLACRRDISSQIFWGAPECAQSLREVGFNCLFLANNHTAQHGKEALELTVSLLDLHEIRHAGFDPRISQSPAPAIFNIRGIRIAFLAYCETQQYNTTTPMLPVIRLDSIARDVNDVRQSNDIVVVSLHWGDEFIDYPSPRQVETAHAISEMGVHLILGHHSHIVQGIETYNNTLIAYSLGSFIKDLWPKRLRESIILRCVLNRKGVVNFSFLPIVISKSHQPTIYGGSASEKFVARIGALSKALAEYNPSNSKMIQKKYENDVRQLNMRDRLGTLFHYITYLPYYEKRLLLQNLKLMIERRLLKTNLW